MKRLGCVLLILFKYVTKLLKKKREETTRVKNVEKVQIQKSKSHKNHLIYIRYNLNTVYIIFVFKNMYLVDFFIFEIDIKYIVKNSNLIISCERHKLNLK